ncbi:phosphate ABC transporter permease subunit PstC [Galenea microaerophila]
MEKIFRFLSLSSATFLLIVLIAIVTVLYLTAKPAIEKFGAYFIIDPRWNVEVQVDAPEPVKKPDTLSQTTDKTETSKESLDESSVPAVDDVYMDEGIPMDGEDYIPMDNEDNIPMEDEHGSTDTNYHPTKGHTETVYGGAVPIVGTIFSTAIAMLFAIPIAMGIAVFLSEIAHEKLVGPIGIAVELLAAIPSIIYGMWALFYFGPFIASIFGGHSVSLLVAGLTLGVMIIPFMAALSRDAINTTPDVLKESAYAIGATKFEVTKDIIFPYAKAGILGSMIISLGRALGETMAVAFVIGGVFEFAHSITDPTNSIPVVLANNFSESSGLSLNALFYLALLLFVVSFIIIFAAKRYFLRRQKL